MACIEVAYTLTAGVRTDGPQPYFHRDGKLPTMLRHAVIARHAKAIEILTRGPAKQSRRGSTPIPHELASPPIGVTAE